MKLLYSSILTLAVSASALFAAPKDIQGFSGTVELTSTLDHGSTVVTFRTLGKANIMNTKVYILQHETSSPVYRDWSGPARLLIGDGIMAILGNDQSRWLFSYPDVPSPASFARFNLLPSETFSIIGIATFGEASRLSESQITSLKQTAQCGALKQSSSHVTPYSVPAGCTNCDAGGEGASSCNLNGVCSVSCNSGYYACCNGATTTCRCCKP